MSAPGSSFDREASLLWDDDAGGTLRCFTPLPALQSLTVSEL